MKKKVNNKYGKDEAVTKSGIKEASSKGSRNRSKGKEFQKNNRIVKNHRTDGADERYASETGPSMKNPNVKNDASWYTYSSDVINVAGSINYNDPIGNPFSEQPTVLDESSSKRIFATDPSVMAIHWCPTPGDVGEGGFPNQSTNAPVNLQVRSLYTLMQATVTQNLPFAAADLGIHIFYMDNVYMMWGHLQRLYYILRRYDVMNRTLPKTLLEAYGLSDAILHNPSYTINDYQADLLSLEQEIKRIAIPSGFDVLNRHYWMSKHVFMDDNSLKPQLYIFVPQYIWGFDDQGTTGGELILNAIPTDSSSEGLKNLVNWFRTYLNKFYNDKDVWTLNGYVLRAFNNFWLPDPLDIAGIIQPSYSPEVLPQIHNATPTGRIFGARTSNPSSYEMQVAPENPIHGRIRQDAYDNITWLPVVVYSNAGVQGAVMDDRILLDMPMPVPSPADNLVATRLITRVRPTVFEVDSTDVATIDIYGTEIVVSIRVYDGVNEGDQLVNLRNITSWGINIFDAGAEGLIVDVRELARICQISKFSYAPLFPMTIDHETTYGWFDYMGTMSHYTVINRNVLKKLHDAAALGEWLIK